MHHPFPPQCQSTPPALRTEDGLHYPADLLAVVQALEMVPQPASLTDKSGLIFYVNPAFFRLYQFRLEAVLGRSPRMLVPRPLPEAFLRELHRAVKAGGWEGDLENVDAAGVRFGFHLHARPLRLDGGAFFCALGIGHRLEPAGEVQALPLHTLSERERQVFDLLRIGEPSKIIASQIGVSSNTVDTYKKRIYRKLGFTSQSHLHHHLLSGKRDRLGTTSRTP